MSESTDTQLRIEEDLARTRARMDGRLNELQERLSPGQILDDVLGYLRGSAGEDFALNFMNSIRNNPMPAAITGIGLAWLMASNPRAHVDDADIKARVQSDSPRSPAWVSHDEFDQHFRDVEHKVERLPTDTEADYQDRLNDAKGRALGVVRNAQDSAEVFGQRVRDALTSAKERISDGARHASEQASDMSGQLVDMAQQTSDRIARGTGAAQDMAGNLLSTITNNPLLLGAISMAAGAVLGALVPQSEQEEAALSGVANQAGDGVRQLTEEALERGSAVAQQVIDVGKTSANTHGLTGKSVGTLVDEAPSGDLVNSVGKVAREALDTGEKAVRTEGGLQDKPAESPHQPHAGK